ncbi:hypothetical protein OG216_19230 [Streptomycetaceae bacterium NBC_01309]
MGEVVRRPYFPPKGFAIVWGRTPTHAAAALLRALSTCRARNIKLIGHIASFTPRMSDGVLVDRARHCASKLVHDIVDGAGFWVVSHSAIDEATRARAYAELAQMWAVHSELISAFERDYGFSLDCEGDDDFAPWYPFRPTNSSPGPSDVRSTRARTTEVERGGGARRTPSPAGRHTSAAPPLLSSTPSNESDGSGSLPPCPLP